MVKGMHEDASAASARDAAVLTPPPASGVAAMSSEAIPEHWT
jgi:hypothetical protein